MVDTFIETLEYFPRGLVYVALGIVVLYIAKWILDLVTPYHVGDQLGEKDNTALGLSITGYFLGVIIVFVAVLYTPFASGEEYQWQFDADFGYDVLEVFLYSLGAIAVLNLTRFLVDRLVLFKFNVEKEVIEDQNAGTGRRRVCDLHSRGPRHRVIAGGIRCHATGSRGAEHTR